MMMLCGAPKGPEEQPVGLWHRDFYPQRCAPLDSYANDIKECGPRKVQWNLALYDVSPPSLPQPHLTTDHPPPQGARAPPVVSPPPLPA